MVPGLGEQLGQNPTPQLHPFLLPRKETQTPHSKHWKGRMGQQEEACPGPGPAPSSQLLCLSIIHCSCVFVSRKKC